MHNSSTSAVPAKDKDDTDTDLMQWLLASQMAQDVVINSLINNDTVTRQHEALKTIDDSRAGGGGGVGAEKAPVAEVIKSPEASGVAPSRVMRSAPPPEKAQEVVAVAVASAMVPPELMHAEQSGRNDIRSAFEQSVATFRHLHPAYLHSSYDWVLGGTRLTLERDRKMFANERHLPAFQQTKKPRNFFPPQLGLVLERMSAVMEAHPAAADDTTAAVGGWSPARQVPAVSVFPGSTVFHAVPTHYIKSTMTASRGEVAAAAGRSSTPLQRLLDANPATTVSPSLSLLFGASMFSLQATMRDTLRLTEEHHRVALYARAQHEILTAASRRSYRGVEQRRQEFCWESTSMVSRNVAPPREAFDMQRHLPKSYRKARPMTAYIPQKPPARPTTAGAATASGPQAAPRVESACSASGAQAITSCSPMSAVLPRAVANYRVQSAPVHRRKQEI